MDANDRHATPYVPISAEQNSIRKHVAPVAFDCIQLMVIRDGSAILSSEFAQKPVTIGDAVLLCANTLCGIEPEGLFTVTTIYVDTDYVIDQVFWQHSALFSDRLDAREFAKKRYVEPAQVLHIGEDLLSRIAPWLDQLVALTTEDEYAKQFNRIQALWFALADVIAPFIKVVPVKLSPSQLERQHPTLPRHRRFVPLRSEAMQVAELLRGDLARHWTTGALAERVHLSESQLSRVFGDAYGKTPMRYLTMLRIEEMARLLRETDLLVEDAIVLVGWHSLSYPIRLFRAYFGVTPGVYRRTHNAVT